MYTNISEHTFLLLGDAHVVADDFELYGQNPARRLKSIVSAIKEDHPEILAAFMLGDIAHGGQDREYDVANEILSDLDCPVYAVAGNHDNRDALVSHFPALRMTSTGYVQYSAIINGIRFIILDTVDESSSNGNLCSSRLEWLEKELLSSDEQVVLLMHHPPLAVGYRVDSIRIHDVSPFLRVIDSYRQRIRHIVFGHIHRTVSGTWEGIPFAGLRGTGHQRIEPQKGRNGGIDHGVPAFAILKIRENSTVIQFRDISVDRSP